MLMTYSEQFIYLNSSDVSRRLEAAEMTHTRGLDGPDQKAHVDEED